MKKKTRKLVAWIVVIAILVTFVAFILIPIQESLPPVTGETPIEPNTPTKPEPDDPEDAEKPEPTEPKLRLVSASEPVKPEIVPFYTLITAIVCRGGKGTVISLDEDSLISGGTLWNDDIREERRLTIHKEFGEIHFLGLEISEEIKALFEEASDPNAEQPADALTIEVPAGTKLGTIGYPLQNNWGEGATLVILVSFSQENLPYLKAVVISIVESID